MKYTNLKKYKSLYEPIHFNIYIHIHTQRKSIYIYIYIYFFKKKAQNRSHKDYKFISILLCVFDKIKKHKKNSQDFFRSYGYRKKDLFTHKI